MAGAPSYVVASWNADDELRLRSTELIDAVMCTPYEVCIYGSTQRLATLRALAHCGRSGWEGAYGRAAAVWPGGMLLMKARELRDQAADLYSDTECTTW